MTAPAITSSTSLISFTSAATTRSVTLPATVSAGDLLMILVAADSGAAVSVSGWTALMWSTSTFYLYSVLYKTATGSEGGTSVTMNVTNGAAYAYATVSVAGADATTMSWTVQDTSLGVTRAVPIISGGKAPTEYLDFGFFAADIVASGVAASSPFTLMSRVASGVVRAALVNSSFTESDILRWDVSGINSAGTPTTSSCLRLSVCASTQNATAGYPYIRSQTYLPDTVGSTSHVLTLPAAANAGELLIVVATLNGGIAVPTTPSGYTVGSTSATDGYAFYYKVATGGETSVTLSSTSQKMDAVFMCVANYLQHRSTNTTAVGSGTSFAVAGSVPIFTSKLLSIVIYWYKTGAGGPTSTTAISSGYIGPLVSGTPSFANTRLFAVEILYNGSATGNQSPGNVSTIATFTVASLNIGVGADNTGGGNLLFGSNF